MSENLPWLFAAFGIAWGLVFGYLVVISKRERETRKRLAELRELVGERSGD